MSSFCKPHVTSLQADYVVDIAKIIAERWFRRIFLWALHLTKIFQLHLMDFLNRAEICENFFFERICDDGFLVFAFLGSTSRHSDLLHNKNHIFLFTQWISASQDSRTGGFIAAKNFPRGDLCPKKTPWPKNKFVQENVSPYLARVHVVWQSTDTPEFNYLGNLFKKMWWPTDKKSSSSETLLLINLLMFLVSVQTCAPLLKTKAYYVALSSTLYYMLTDH